MKFFFSLIFKFLFKVYYIGCKKILIKMFYNYIGILGLVIYILVDIFVGIVVMIVELSFCII